MGLPVEEREGVDVAEIGFADERLDGRRPREHRLDLASAGGDLHFLERLEVVGVGRDDGEDVGLGVEDDGADTDLLGEPLRHHVEHGARDLGLRELLRGREVDLVLRREDLQEVGLGGEAERDHDFFDALTGPLHVRDHRLDLVGLEQALLHEKIANSFGLCCEGGSLGDGGHAR